MSPTKSIADYQREQLETPSSGGAGGGWTQVVDESGASLANWTSESGTWSIQGGVIQCVGAANAYSMLKYNTLFPLNQLAVEFEYKLDVIGGTDTSALFYQAASGTVGGVTVRVGTDGSNRTYKIERFGQATVASGNIGAGTGVGTWYKLRAHYNDGAVTFWIGDTLIDTAMCDTIADLSGFRLGIFTNVGAGTVTVQFRNIKVYRPKMPWDA